MGEVKKIMPTGAFDTVEAGGAAASQINIPSQRPRGLTGLMAAGDRPASTSTVVLLVILLSGGTASAGWGAAVFSGGRDVEAVQDEQAQMRTELEGIKTRLTETEEAQEADARLIRTQLAYQRWIVSALKKNNEALGAIVKTQDLDVDVTLPSLDLDDVLGNAP